MLCIPDIHIHPRFSQAIIDAIDDIITKNPDEQTIVFLGDYVFHFSYHKKSLSMLMQYFLDLFRQGKNVYVLAGNHDRLGESFVFSDGQLMTNLFHERKSQSNTPGRGVLHFITQPQIHTIEGQTVAFLPSTITPYTVDQALYEKNRSNHPTIDGYCDSLLDTKNKQLILTQSINRYLISISDIDDLLVIHHRYVGDTIFPGIKGKFRYDDGAIHAGWLDTSLRFVSGHIHSPFCYKNYLCIGSMRYTNANEVNHPKYCVIIHKHHVKRLHIIVNPQLRCPSELVTSVEDCLTLRYQYCNDRSQHITDNVSRSHTIQTYPTIHQDQLKVTLTLPQSPDEEQSARFSERSSSLKELTRSKQSTKIATDIHELTVSLDTISESVNDRRKLLIARLDQKYADNASTYKDILHELGIL